MDSLSRVGLVAILLGAPLASAQQAAEKPVSELSLEELMDASIVSASNRRETLAEAPATVIVISREDIRERGYTELSEVLDDLPGMDVIRPYGDTYLKDYWRGYRNTIGEPFLIMVDGLVFNHLYYNTGDILVTFPLQSIERVEVVYGPASSVYGPNAFMGVVNVITQGGPPGQHVALTAGSAEARIVDASVSWSRDDLHVSVAARFENGLLEPGNQESYEYTREHYYSDRRLWGGFVDNANLAGSFHSPRRQRGLQARVSLGELELGFDQYVLDSGYGLVYAADQAQNNVVWARPDQSWFLRLSHPLGHGVVSTTTARYRTSNLRNDSTFLESYQSNGVQVADFSYWQSLNSSLSAFQDFELQHNDRLSVTAGLKYEQKDLQKAYDLIYGPAVPVAGLNLDRYPFPQPPIDTSQAQNRITTEDRGAYVQARYRAGQRHNLNLGLRHDRNSQYGAATTVRAGYVGRFGRWVAKALYGEAFQEPTPRLLYGGWRGSGSDPDLRPERSRTVEASSVYAASDVRGLLSVYYVKNRDTIINTASGAQNLGDRQVVGFDGHLEVRRSLGANRHLRMWGYYSRLLRAEETTPVGTTSIGDLAKGKLMLGASLCVDGRYTASLRARHIGSRDTVATNPIRSVPAYTTADLTLSADDLGIKGLGLSLKLTNLLDAEYFQPGIRDANAGDTPGAFDAAGVWHGSGGFYNSLLPQPGRAALLTLRLNF